MDLPAALRYLETHPGPSTSWPSPDTPVPGAVGAWQTARARSGCLVSIRWDWRRREEDVRWVVVAHDEPVPRVGDLRVLSDASDEGRAREKAEAMRASDPAVSRV